MGTGDFVIVQSVTKVNAPRQRKGYWNGKAFVRSPKQARGYSNDCTALAVMTKLGFKNTRQVYFGVEVR